ASRRRPARLSSDFPIDCRFSFCSHAHRNCPDVNASQRSKKSEAETATLVEAEVDEAIAACGDDVHAALRATLIANTYLEAENRTIDRASRGGGCARHSASHENLEVNVAGTVRSGVLSCNDYD